MRTKAFIESNCKYRCPHFDSKWGCGAYAGEECDAAFLHSRWRGLSMRQRIEDYCEAHSKDTRKEARNEKCRI